jgi:murein DD-endopeptidase MepM/ murein hydrolase activator NlpD
VSHRFGTFMFIPHEKSMVKSINLTRRGALGFAAGAVGLCGLLVVVGAFGFGGSGDSPVLTSENSRLRTELTEMEGQVALLSNGLESLLTREEELRILADLPPVPVEVQAVGVGGPGHAGVDGTVSSADRELNNRVASVSASMDELLRRSALVASSMDDVRKAIAAKKERFARTPSIWPSSGFLSSTFSLNRRHPIFHDVRPHYGIDISARRGSPIVSTADGTVTKSGWENGHGNMVEIDHGHGLRTTYSHAARVLVTSGQRVSRGETIALVGSTGFSVAPHVHYEVHENGRPIDPLRYIFPDAIAD